MKSLPKISFRSPIIRGSIVLFFFLLVFVIVFRGGQEDLDGQRDLPSLGEQTQGDEIISLRDSALSASSTYDEDEVYYPNGRKPIKVTNPSHGIDGKFEESGQLVNDSLPEKERIVWVQDLLFQMKTILKNEDIDWSSNADVIQKLLGHNEHDLIFIHEDHPAINEFGELTDRWNSPYFFHALSGKDFELRSAGEDLEFYTDDDVVVSNVTELPEKYKILNENITRP